MTLQTLPIEIIYDTLIRTNENDIMNYCATTHEAHIICADPIFWLRKLDYDFDKGISLKPSYYAQRYNHDTDRHVTYTRWKTYNGDHPVSNIDIIMYNIDQGLALRPGIADIFALMRYALVHNDVELWESLQVKQLLIRPDDDNNLSLLLDIMTPAGEINLCMMQWLEDYGMPITSNLVYNFCIIGDIEILKWFYAKNIIPTDDDLIQAIAFGQIDIVRWAINIGIPLTQIHANIAVEVNNICILNILYAQGILPNSECFLSGVARKSITAIRWAIMHGVEIPNNINKKITRMLKDDQKLIQRNVQTFIDMLPKIKDDLI